MEHALDVTILSMSHDKYVFHAMLSKNIAIPVQPSGPPWRSGLVVDLESKGR